MNDICKMYNTCNIQNYIIEKNTQLYYDKIRQLQYLFHSTIEQNSKLNKIYLIDCYHYYDYNYIHIKNIKLKDENLLKAIIFRMSLDYKFFINDNKYVDLGHYKAIEFLLKNITIYDEIIKYKIEETKFKTLNDDNIILELKRQLYIEKEIQLKIEIKLNIKEEKERCFKIQEQKEYKKQSEIEKEKMLQIEAELKKKKIIKNDIDKIKDIKELKTLENDIENDKINKIGELLNEIVYLSIKMKNETTIIKQKIKLIHYERLSYKSITDKELNYKVNRIFYKKVIRTKKYVYSKYLIIKKYKNKIQNNYKQLNKITTKENYIAQLNKTKECIDIKLHEDLKKYKEIKEMKIKLKITQEEKKKTRHIELKLKYKENIKKQILELLNSKNIITEKIKKCALLTQHDKFQFIMDKDFLTQFEICKQSLQLRNNKHQIQITKLTNKLKKINEKEIKQEEEIKQEKIKQEEINEKKLKRKQLKRKKMERQRKKEEQFKKERAIKKNTLENSNEKLILYSKYKNKLKKETNKRKIGHSKKCKCCGNKLK